jgi:putative heme-binding domain-containing protein
MSESAAVELPAATAARRAAITLLGYASGNRLAENGGSEDWASGKQAADVLRRLAGEPSNIDLLPEILAAWSRTNDPGCDAELEKFLAVGAPIMRGTAARLIARSQSRLSALAEKIANNELAPKVVGAAHLQSFIERGRGETRQILQEALNQLVNSDRKQIVAQYQPALELEGNRKRGKLVFSKNCAACHRIGDMGVDIGPDISDSRTKQPLQLLTSILDPNQAIDNNYFRFVVLTADGRIEEGMIAEETEQAIILLGQDNQRAVVYREDIEQLKATGVSLMPEGLEAEIDHQAMADLLAFIKGWRYSGQVVPGL